MSEATRGLFEGSDHVEAPDHEWLGDGDGLKLGEFAKHRTSILHTCGPPPLHLAAQWASKNLSETLS